jgi:Tol biopolymer transport system component
LIYIQSPGIYDVYFQPQYKYLAYTKDTDGNENFQLYLYETAGGNSKQLSDGKSRNTEPVWATAGDQIVYGSSPSGSVGVNLRVLNPFDPKTDRLLAQSSGTYLKAYAWSPDDKQVIFCDFLSNTTSTLWLVEVSTGRKVLLSPRKDEPEFYDYPQFTTDGKGVFVLTDHDSDVRRIARIDLASRRLTYIPSDPKWDVDEFQISPDGRTIAFTTNEGGVSRLH